MNALIVLGQVQLLSCHYIFSLLTWCKHATHCNSHFRRRFSDRQWAWLWLKWLVLQGRDMTGVLHSHLDLKEEQHAQTIYIESRLCHDVSSWGPRCQRCLSMPVVIPGKEKDFPQRSAEVYISDVPKGQHCWLDNPHGSTNVQPLSLLSLSSSSSSSPPPAPRPPSVIHESQGAMIMIHDILWYIHRLHDVHHVQNNHTRYAHHNSKF